MAWTPDFLGQIEGAGVPIRPMYILETITPPEEVGRGEWRLVSHETLYGLPLLGTGWGRIQGTGVQPRSWAISAGGWSVPLVGRVEALKGRIWRGQLVRLRIGFPGWAENEYEPVALGQVWNLRGTPGRYTLEMRDIFSALGSRITATASYQPLFHDVGTSTALTAAYTAGDAAITVTSTAGFARQDDGTGTLKGGLLITPDAGSPFYLTWTGTAGGGTQFTGLPAVGQFGTTAGDAAIGKAVTEVVYFDDDPISAVRKILAGGTWASPALAARLAAQPEGRAPALPHERLSEREFQVFRMLAQGRPGKVIAADLGISQKTVTTHRARLLLKLGLRSTAELVQYAVRHGFAG